MCGMNKVCRLPNHGAIDPSPPFLKSSKNLNLNINITSRLTILHTKQILLSLGTEKSMCESETKHLSVYFLNLCLKYSGSALRQR